MSLPADRNRALSRGLVQLAGPAGPADRAHVLARTTADAFATGAAVVILSGPGRPGGQIEAVAGSDDGCHGLAELERETGDGPGLTSARGGHPLTLADLPSTQSRWAGVASDLGWQHACALPLLAGGPCGGALVLLSPDAKGPADDALTWARTLAAVAATGWEQQFSLEEARSVTRQLERALQSRIVIEQAKGMLAERGGIDLGTAFTRMRRYARTRRRGLREVALDVLRGAAADAVLTHTGPEHAPGRGREGGREPGPRPRSG